MEAESPFYTKKQGVAGAALASTMHSIASAVPPPAAASTNEAAAKVNRLRVRLGPGPVTAALATMASAAPAAAVMSTDEAAAKPAYLARMEAESRFYPKKQGVTGAAQASAVASMASSGSLSAATSTNEATAKAAYLARMEAESPFRGVQLLRLSRLRPQRVQMRRLPKQLTLLDWKRSRLSARRSK